MSTPDTVLEDVLVLFEPVMLSRTEQLRPELLRRNDRPRFRLRLYMRTDEQSAWDATRQQLHMQPRALSVLISRLMAAEARCIELGWLDSEHPRMKARRERLNQNREGG